MITDRRLEVPGRMTTPELVELWESAGSPDDGLAALAKLPRLAAGHGASGARARRRLPASVRVSASIYVAVLAMGY